MNRASPNLLKVALVQMNSLPNQEANLIQAESLIAKAADLHHPDLVALPELWSFYGGSSHEKHAAGLNYTAVTNKMSHLAKKYRITLHGGSILVPKGDKMANVTFVYDTNGDELATYQKVHLFSFLSTDGKAYDERKMFTPGSSLAVYQCQGFTVGCVICYDLRFPLLFAELIKKDVNLFILPSAFTYETGKAHWQILCRARAIETSSYFCAPAQTGVHVSENQERRCYGHSLIVDPWGSVLAEADENPGIIVAEFNMQVLTDIRTRLTAFRQLSKEIHPSVA